MLKIYNTDIETNKIEEIKEFKKGSWISLVNPSENEIKKVCSSSYHLVKGKIRQRLTRGKTCVPLEQHHLKNQNSLP